MTVIVPVDFSAASVNAAAFAANMLTGVYGADLLLYHLSPKVSDLPEAEKNLNRIKDTLRNSTVVKMRCEAEVGTSVAEAVERKANLEDASLLVMAVSDREKVFDESYALQLIQRNPCPVLVVPYGQLYREVKSIALASDFTDVEKTIPLAKVKTVLDIFRPTLHIVHVNPDIYVSLTEAQQAEQAKLRDLFSDYQPQFHFITLPQFEEGLNAFVESHGIDLVLTFPRRHGYLSALLKGTHTRKLVYQKRLPVLAAH